MEIYTHAILRQPARSIVNAISQDPERDKPDYTRALEEHARYAETLKKMGLIVTVCPADEAFPDGNFVEDTYLILVKQARIELNPGAAARAHEPMSLAPYLPQNLTFHKLSKQHTIDGGDILQDDKTLYVGLSRRTQSAAIEELKAIVGLYDYAVHVLEVPEGLHLKSGMTCLASKHFIIQAAFEPLLKKMQEEDRAIQYFVVPQAEHFAANVLPINDKIMIPSECPKTKAYIEKCYASADIFEVDTHQVRLIDGALTCGSLLF